jgi:hypothetical protein
VCGIGLSAPLLLPGVQLALASSRRSATGAPAFPLTNAANLLASGFQGGDFKTAAYVGVAVLALGVVGLRVAWTRPHVPALAAVVVVTGLLTFFSPVDGLLHRLPGAKAVAWSRAVMLLALALAVLAAVGVEALVRAARRPSGETGGSARLAAGWAAGAFGVLGLMVLGLEVAAQVGLASAVSRHQSSLVWPAAQAVVGGAVTWAWWRSLRPAAARAAHAAPRSGWVWRTVPALLLALETGFLLSAGIPSWSVSSTYFATTPAITELQQTVGSALVGFGRCSALQFNTASKAEVGIRPNANIGYGVHEMTVYDPIIPDDYFHAWYALTGQHSLPSLAALGIFCPRINTVTEARVFGVQYVLEPIGRLGPQGSVFVRNVPGESLWSIPGSVPATASPVPAGGAVLPTTGAGSPLSLTTTGSASLRLTVDETVPSIVRLRLTDVPGWHASIDGRPLSLQPWASGSMLEARVPAGSHVIVLHYWPDAFSAGLVLGAVVVVGFVATGMGLAMAGARRRRAAPGP